MKIVLAVYVTAVALLPFSHHDLACHLKSTTHCLSCVVGGSGEAAPEAAGTIGTALVPCGCTPSLLPHAHDTTPDGVVAGRSPPARG